MDTSKENVSVRIQEKRLLLPDNNIARVITRKKKPVTEAISMKKL